MYKTYGSGEVPDASVKTVNGLGIILLGGRSREAVIYAEDRIYDILLSHKLDVKDLDAIATSVAEQIEVE